MPRTLSVLGLAFLLAASAAARPPVAAILTVTTSADSGAGSLRQAILDSNASAAVVDTIQFSIGGGGVQTIAPTSALPAITDPCTIDGTTQTGYAGAPLIEIDGVSAGSATGLTLSAPNVTVRGLAVTRFSNAGIRVNADAAVIQGCYLGLAPDGATAKGNGVAGVRLDGTGTVFGGSLPGQGNVVSGNSPNPGIGGFGYGTIRGNKIGTNAAGTAAVPNSPGIWMAGTGSVFVTIGGTAAGQGNLISGNGSSGVRMEVGAYGTIAGNLIGTDAAGSAAIPNFEGLRLLSDNVTLGGASAAAGNVISGNSQNGVVVAGGDPSIRYNLIGRTAGNGGPLGNGASGILVTGIAEGGVVETNVIAHNGLHGVYVDGGRRNRCRENSIHSNGGDGIRLGANVANDELDTDVGANDLQNRPVLDGAYVNGAGTTILTGSLRSTPNMNFRLEFFDNAPGEDEGETFLHVLISSTDATGVVYFTVFLPVPVAAGRNLTATATDGYNNSSPFSNAVSVRAEGNLPTASIISPPGATFGTAASAIPMTITATDDVGVTSVQAWNDALGFGISATFSAGSTWTVDVPLLSGENEITVTAYDAAGNSATDTVVVTRDSVAPTVAITVPTSGPTHSGTTNPLSVWGTAADDVGVASVTWSNAAGGSGTALGTDLWAAAVPLVEGANVITVTATDVGGNTTTDMLSVEYSLAGGTTVVNEGDDCGLLGAEMLALLLVLRALRSRCRGQAAG